MPPQARLMRASTLPLLALRRLQRRQITHCWAPGHTRCAVHQHSAAGRQRLLHIADCGRQQRQQVGFLRILHIHQVAAPSDGGQVGVGQRVWRVEHALQTRRGGILSRARGGQVARQAAEVDRVLPLGAGTAGAHHDVRDAEGGYLGQGSHPSHPEPCKAAAAGLEQSWCSMLDAVACLERAP